MSQPIIVKAYGGFLPATPAMRIAMDQALETAIPPCRASIRENLLSISFEGIYFPLDEILEIVRQYATRETTGRLDVLDIEDWRLLRHELAGGEFSVHRANLNNVLDYSGF